MSIPQLIIFGARTLTLATRAAIEASRARRKGASSSGQLRHLGKAIALIKRVRVIYVEAGITEDRLAGVDTTITELYRQQARVMLGHGLRVVR